MVGGCHYADIHVDFLASTKAVIRHTIKNAQQLDLDFGIKVSDFIQEKSAAVGHFKIADFLRVSATESTLLISKEFAFNQMFRNSGAVYVYPGLVAAKRMAVDCP